ncbi:acyl carrier protein [Ligilactobacillus salitolerans]|uniref:Acyl carrier protein n=1 Tax=Ligilactobacillus salitolerans TaxID=1808352 RepID=A0A401IRG9_9LACO|nr:acyl carrier protein [Ligilactobacillus salitolerans]GBG94133.1 acyl carrier protein [Ligilactobacillus salitolerans]
MTEQEVFTKIAAIIEERFGVAADKVTKELNFQDDLDADSIDIVEFVLELEDTFGAEISDDDAEQLTTVGQAVSYIAEHQNA